MALKSDDAIEKNPDEKNPLSFVKRKFNILIGLLIAVIILLFIIIIVLTTSNILGGTNNQANNESDYNSTEKLPYQLLKNDDENEPQLLNSLHKIIYRSKWGGRPPLYERPQKVPVKYVIISHTAGVECFNLIDCSKQMQRVQSFHVHDGSPDIGYNFLIGGDGNIYVARGWDNHNFHMSLDTIGICFIGNYLYNVLSSGMIGAAQDLLKQGVELGKLTKDYIIVAHNQTWNTQSPGRNVYKQIKFWPHFSPEEISEP